MKRKFLMATLLLSVSIVGCGNSATVEPKETVAESTEAVVEETEAVEEETEEVEETEAAETIGVKEMSATKYTNCEVNVRSGASKEYEVIGTLKTNQKVIVTGQADTGWYRVDYNGAEGYVSNKCLSDEKATINTEKNTGTTSAVVTPEPTPEAGTEGTTTTVTPEVNYGGAVVVPETSVTPEPTPSVDNGGTAVVPTPTPVEPTPTPDAGSSTVDGNTAGLTPDQLAGIQAEEERKQSTADLLEGAEIIGGDGTWKPTTDGYGDGVTITIEPVQ